MRIRSKNFTFTTGNTTYVVSEETAHIIDYKKNLIKEPNYEDILKAESILRDSEMVASNIKKWLKYAKKDTQNGN